MSEPADLPAPASPVLLLVDAANVVGSVPDGWWRDRAGATQRLCDRIGAAHELLTGAELGLAGPVEVVVVVEGAASGVRGNDQVRVVASSGIGDDTIVELVERAAPRPCVVVTADQALRARLARLGAAVLGPGVLRAYRR